MGSLLRILRQSCTIRFGGIICLIQWDIFIQGYEVSEMFPSPNSLTPNGVGDHSFRRNNLPNLQDIILQGNKVSVMLLLKLN
jgi:hypothetical protein